MEASCVSKQWLGSTLNKFNSGTSSLTPLAPITMHEMKIETTRILEPSLSPYHSGEKLKRLHPSKVDFTVVSTWFKQLEIVAYCTANFNLKRGAEISSNSHCLNWILESRYFVIIYLTYLLYLYLSNYTGLIFNVKITFWNCNI